MQAGVVMFCEDVNGSGHSNSSFCELLTGFKNGCCWHIRALIKFARQLNIVWFYHGSSPWLA